MAYFKLKEVSQLPDDSTESTAAEVRQQLEAYLDYLDKENEKLKNIKLISVIDLGADYF